MKPLSETEFIAAANLIAAGHGCRVDVDIETKTLNFLGPEKARLECAIAIGNFFEKYEVPEGIEAGPVDIRVQFTQGELTTEFDAIAELVEVPHKKDHIIQFVDDSSAGKGK